MKIFPRDIAEAVYRALEGKSEEGLSFALRRSVQVIADKGMLGKSEEILGALQSIFDKKTGTVRMKVTAAKSMDQEERNKLENKIKEKYNAKIVAGEFFEKEELLGGMRIEIGDKVLDSTYRNKLHELEIFLTRKK